MRLHFEEIQIQVISDDSSRDEIQMESKSAEVKWVRYATPPRLHVSATQRDSASDSHHPPAVAEK